MMPYKHDSVHLLDGPHAHLSAAWRLGAISSLAARPARVETEAMEGAAYGFTFNSAAMREVSTHMRTISIGYACLPRLGSIDN